MTVNQPIALKLEIERVNLLYRQNIQGVMGLSLFAFAYAYVCGNLMPTPVLIIWLTLIILTALSRLIGTLQWNQKWSSLSDLSQVNRWYYYIQGMLVISGIIWGYAAWVGARSADPAQQIVTAITVIFMAAGALVCWAPSLRAMFSFVIPSIVPWTLSYVLSEDPTYQLIGTIGIFYVALGMRAGLSLNRYIDKSLKLNIENSQLTKDLKQEIGVKDRAEEALRLALSSSDAIEWRWNVESDLFICQGDLSRSFGLNTNYFSGSLDELAHLFYPDDQEKFRAMMLRLALKGGELDTDLRINWPDGQIHDLAFRGKTQKSSDGKISHLTGIAWDTTVQKSQARLKQEKDVHEAANKAKSVFLANASHEIRTPLAAINGYVEGLLQEPGQSEGLKTDLQAISRNGKFLASLVNDFLDLSKIESGQFYMQKGTMSPRQEIEEALQLVKPALQVKGLSLEVIYESAMPLTIESDPTRFRQILVNLLSNAAKFTDKGKITVRVHHKISSQEEGYLSIRVADTGVGIDERTKSQLFEPFMRGQTLEVQRVYGAGLGLALSKNLAQILGGDLRLNFSSPKEGTEFEFSVATGPVSLLNFPVKISPDTMRRPLTHMKVLVVDDAIDLRILMRRYLEKQGAVVESCENGLEAVEKAMAGSFDIILMDIKMPVMDGHEATTNLRKRGFKKPIIAITAHASTDDKKRSLEAGCDFYLSKPVDFSFLTETILKTQKSKIEERDNTSPDSSPNP